MLVAACSGPEQVAADQDQCLSFESDVAIGGCTALIQSGRETPDQLAAAFFNRGFAYYTKRQYDLAIQDFDQAIGLQPDAAPGSGQAISLAVTFDYRGNAYRRDGKYGLAIADLDEAVRLNPHAAETLVDRGIAFFDARQYDRAVQDFDQAIRLASNFGLAFYNRGIALRALGQQDRAEADFARARQLDPGLPLPPAADGGMAGAPVIPPVQKPPIGAAAPVVGE
jgi:tetratricopeptide (TPR) repeat protein